MMMMKGLFPLGHFPTAGNWRECNNGFSFIIFMWFHLSCAAKMVNLPQWGPAGRERLQNLAIEAAFSITSFYHNNVCG
jgi:hypothetical protein